jgi:primase-polymerase (primpol)-like protein
MMLHPETERWILTSKPVDGTVQDVSVIPSKLRETPQWVLWRWIQRDGKWTKPPFQTDGSPADTTDSSTWSSFSEAMSVYNSGSFNGIGYVTTAEDGIVGVTWTTAGILRPETSTSGRCS